MENQATIRQRKRSDVPSEPDDSVQLDSPPSPSKTSRRPTLSRTVTGDGAHPYEVDEPLFSGLGLLDLLVVVDAHLELWTRSFRKKSSAWKEKADRLVEAQRQRAQKINRLKLPRVTSDAFLSNVLNETRDAGILSQSDRDKLEKRIRRVRERTSESMRKMIVVWEREKTVQLRDKISFFCGVMNVLGSALLVQRPEWIPAWYTAQIVVQIPLRAYTYKKKAFHYFLFDLCYAVNLMCLTFLWILPGNEYLFQACWGLTLGTLGTAIATWRNSLVFHSLDKVISLTIHIYPPFVFTMIRHFDPTAPERYPALAKLPHLSPWRSIGINMLAYLVWQGLYFRYVIVARKEKIKEGRATSFTYMINDKKSIVGKIAKKVPPHLRETAFMGGQAIYTFVTLLIPIFVLYDSKVWSSVYLLAVFGVSVWNGACFYMEVFSRKFEKELKALRLEFEQQQQEIIKLTANAAHGTGPESEVGDFDHQLEHEHSPELHPTDTSPELFPHPAPTPSPPPSLGSLSAVAAAATGATDELAHAEDKLAEAKKEE